MSVNLIFKIAAVGILVSVLGQILKQSGREEHAFLTGIAGIEKPPPVSRRRFSVSYCFASSTRSSRLRLGT